MIVLSKQNTHTHQPTHPIDIDRKLDKRARISPKSFIHTQQQMNWVEFEMKLRKQSFSLFIFHICCSLISFRHFSRTSN